MHSVDDGSAVRIGGAGEKHDANESKDAAAGGGNWIYGLMHHRTEYGYLKDNGNQLEGVFVRTADNFSDVWCDMFPF